MKNFIKTAIVFLLGLFPIITGAKVSLQHTSKLPSSVTINLIIQDTTMISSGVIQFILNKDNVNSEYTKQVDISEFKILAPQTKIVLQLSTAINYGRINYEFSNQSQSGVKRPFSVGNNLFIFQAGDNISIYISKTKVQFKGADADKYNLLYEISQHKLVSKAQKQATQLFFENKDYDAHFMSKMHHQDSIYKVRLGILENYKPRIGNKIYNLVSADLWGQYNLSVMGAIFSRLSIRAHGPEYAASLTRNFEEYQKKLSNNSLADSVLVQSYRYCDFLIWNEKSKQELYNSMKPEKDRLPRFTYLYNSILKGYSGFVRDKMILLSFYIGRTDKSNINQFFEDAILKTSNIAFKKMLTEHIKNLSTVAYPFTMPDKNGKIYRMQDFKGKIVVLDFWYTGCPGCVGMAKSLKLIIKEYKPNPNIVFISVSIDGDKFRHLWLKSLKDEIYSSEAEINLLATEGGNSEIIKHYNILSYPRLIVISKNGEVITTNPPDPRKDGIMFKNFLDENL